jgi:predicted aspartyl protease
LIDTGADGCVVKHEFAERAGLKLINDNFPLHGVGIDTTGKAYMGRILFGRQSRVVAGVMQWMFVDTQVVSGNLASDLFDGLIGRDVLQHFQLSYDGKTGVVRMKYHRPEVPGTV